MGGEQEITKPRISVRAVLLCVFSPRRFLPVAVKHDTQLHGEANTTEINRMSRLIQQSLRESLLLVALAVALGAGAGQVLSSLCGPSTGYGSRGLQWFGIGILLWATLSLLGWELPDGQTLAEKVNRWLYRGLYLIGTALLACSVSWPTVATLG